MTLGCKGLNSVEGVKLISRVEMSIEGSYSSFQYMSKRNNYTIVMFLSENAQVHLITPSLYFGSWHQLLLHLLPVL